MDSKMKKVLLEDHSHFINDHSSRRRPGITRELTKRLYNAPKDSVSLAEGMPNDFASPFESVNVTLKDGSSFNLQGAELYSALQYIPSQGYPPLVETLKDFTKYIHNPTNWELRDIVITTGSQCGISKSIEMCIAEGCPVLVQDPIYTGTEIILKPFKAILLPIAQDEYGIVPSKLLKAIEDWKEKCLHDTSLIMPKVFYLNPTGANPTGTTIPLERRKEIYRICCKYNILIFEDDPYYFLDFENSRPTSFLSLDTQNRVLRFDSLSKVLSPGLRIGWVTGPTQLIRTIELHIQSAYLHNSSFCQAMAENLFKSWGYEKMLSHFESIRKFYKTRRDITVAAMEMHLKGLCDWHVPSGGMFVWFKVRNVADVYEMLMNRGVKKGVSFAPGLAFRADQTTACNYIRGAYSRATPKQIDKAMKVLAEVIREEQLLLSRKLDDLI